MTRAETSWTVGELVARRPASARVLERHGLDYCCGGKRPLAQACAERGLPVAELLAEIDREEATAPAGPQADVSGATLSELIDDIVGSHHAFLRRELPRLTELIERTVAAHAGRHPDLCELQRVFLGLRTELELHMRKEEEVLFPMLRTIEAASTRPAFHCGSLANPIRVMEDEHDRAGEALASMRRLTEGYAPPADACHTYRAALTGLAELEADLHRHIHKENNILFPRALEAEARLA